MFRPPSGRRASRLSATKSVGSRLAKKTSAFDYGKDWEQTKERIKRRFNYTCQQCGWRPQIVWKRRYLHVHHKKSLSRGGSNDDENLTLLCLDCHAEAHGGKDGHLRKWKQYKFKD